jgi:hypothetical protein
LEVECDSAKRAQEEMKERLTELNLDNTELNRTFDPGEVAWIASSYDFDGLDPQLQKGAPGWKGWWKHCFIEQVCVTNVKFPGNIIDLDPTSDDAIKAIIEEAMMLLDAMKWDFIPVVADGGEYWRIAQQVYGTPHQQKILPLFGGFHFLK